MKPPSRLTSETFTVSSPKFDPHGNQIGEHSFDIQVGYTHDNQVIEIAFVGRGKIGQGIDSLFQDVGIWLSRILQNRNPMNGKEN